MTKHIVTLLLIAVAVCCAQDEPKTKTARTATPDRGFVQKVWDGWSTMNPDSVAAYYDKSATALFFDIAPLKYDGWQQYADGVRKLLADYQSIKLTLGPDAQFHRSGNLVWADATGTLDFSLKNGTKGQLPIRWTAVLEKKAGKWLFVHEHTSVPLPETK